MKPGTRITGDKVKRGMVVRLVRYSWERSESAGRPRYVVEQEGINGHTFEYVGKAREVDLSGSEYPAFLFKGKLIIGCQEIDALKAFKNLGKALGYEIDG